MDLRTPKEQFIEMVVVYTLFLIFSLILLYIFGKI